MTRAEFVQYGVIRFAHEPDKVGEVIDRLEKLAAALECRGYGFDTHRGNRPTHVANLEPIQRPASSWDGLPEPTVTVQTYHPAHSQPRRLYISPPQTRESMFIQYQDYLRYEAVRPEDIGIKQTLAALRKKLGIDDKE